MGSAGVLNSVGQAAASTCFVLWLLTAGILEGVKFIIWGCCAGVLWILASVLTLSNAAKRPLYWKWHKVDSSALSFPDDFLWGVCTAAHQVEGGNTNSNWSRWESVQRPPGQPPTIKGGQVSGAACDHWNRVEEDVSLIKALGVRGHRFSIEWSRVEPSQGVWDQAAIDHYHHEIDTLKAAGIVPMVTLLHFTHPLWFDDMGGFERTQNVQAFVDFGRRMYREYGGKVELWCTINEPAVCTANGYVTGLFPPGKLGAMQLAGEVVCNLLRAHVQVYLAIKEEAAAAGRDVKVGIVKDIFQFHPAKWHNLLDRYLAWQCDHLFNGCILGFFRTGRFRFWCPFLANVSFHDPRALHSNDFVGLNYYSHYYTSTWTAIAEQQPEEKLLAAPHEVMTDMPHCMYPEGLYSALKEMARLGKPVYVTENGIADADDSRRSLYLKRYLYALSKAIADGVDVRGYFYWSLMDNFEWCEGYNMRFGLYEVDFSTQKRTLRDSAKYFTTVVERYHRGEFSSARRADLKSGGGQSTNFPPHSLAAVSDAV